MNTLPTTEFLRATGGRRPIRVVVNSAESRAGKTYEFTQPFILVGRQPRADLCLDDSDVSGRQVYLQMIGGRLFGVHLSDRVPTRWGSIAQPAGWVDSHTALGFGPYTLRFPDVADSASAIASLPVNPLASGSHPGPPVILELQNSSSGTRVAVNRKLTLVGNASICKLRMNSSRVSSIHCSLVRTGGGLMVVDLGSREGVLVNECVTRAALLTPGDIVELGGRSLLVSYDPNDMPPPTDGLPPGGDEAVAFRPTELAGPADRQVPPAGTPFRSADPAEFVNALGPVMDRFSSYQAQTFDQFQEVMATMLRVFGAMFTEHREFVKDEIARLEDLTRVLANDRPEPATPAGPATASAPPGERAGKALDLSVPLPPLDPTADEKVHLWLQQRIGELGEERASLWRKMAGMLRTRDLNSQKE